MTAAPSRRGGAVQALFPASLFPSILLMAALAGCDQAPTTGQVVARVDGVEITRRDLAGELGARGMSAGDGGDQARRALDVVVDRRLVAAKAASMGLDETPDYLAAVRRSTEMLLSAQLVERWRREVAPADPVTVARFIAAHPQQFAGRAFIDLDQLTTPAPIPADLLAQASTLDDLRRLLTGQGLAFDRRVSAIDTARVDPAYADMLRSIARSGKPVAQPLGKGMSVSAVSRLQPAPLSPADQQALARQMLVQQALQRRVDRLKADADIRIDQAAFPATPAR